MSHPLVVNIAANGEASLVYHPAKQSEEAEEIGGELGLKIEDRRGGHVWPKRPVKRFAFKALRKVFGSKGRVSDWTRSWRGPWVVCVPSTKQYLDGTYRTHDEAVDAEVAYILSDLVGPAHNHEEN